MNNDENTLTKNEIVSIEEISEEKNKLDQASLQIIKQTIAENDSAKTKDLTIMFNNIQKKKAMVRVDKLNTLLDVITDQAIERFTLRPDELSNQELFQGLKTVQELTEKNQKIILDQQEAAPLIQINQQEVNVGTTIELTRESRDKVKTAVANVLASLAVSAKNNAQEENIVEAEVIEANYVEVVEGDQEDD